MSEPTKACIKALKRLGKVGRTGKISARSCEWIRKAVNDETDPDSMLTVVFLERGLELFAEAKSQKRRVDLFLNTIGLGWQPSSQRQIDSKQLNFAKLRVRGIPAALRAFETSMFKLDRKKNTEAYRELDSAKKAIRGLIDVLDEVKI